MNKRQILASLSKIANKLDISGLYSDATLLTNVMKRLAEETSKQTEEEDLDPDDGLSDAQKEAFQIYSDYDIRKNPKFEKLSDESKTSAFAVNKNWLDYHFNLFPKSFGEPQLRSLKWISDTHNLNLGSSTNILEIEDPVVAQNYILDALAEEDVRQSFQK